MWLISELYFIEAFINLNQISITLKIPQSNEISLKSNYKITHQNKALGGKISNDKSSQNEKLAIWNEEKLFQSRY